jgi:uncharacterized membrane protein
MIDLIVKILIPLAISLCLSLHGVLKGSLSRSGAIFATIVGFISFASNMRLGLILILFYYSSSKFTRKM